MTPCAVRATALQSHRPPSYRYARGLYQLVGMPVLTKSRPCEKPRHSFSLRHVALAEIDLPEAFASHGHRIRVCDECVHINPAGALYKVFDLRIRYFGLQNAIHRGREAICESGMSNVLCSLETATWVECETRVDLRNSRDAEPPIRLARTLGTRNQGLGSWGGVSGG